MGSLMYESFFGLKKRPFTSVPSLDRYFPAEGIEQAYRTVVRVIERSEGPVAAMGPTGVGKSLLCLRIADTFRRQYEVVLLTSSKLCTRRALLQSLLFELRMPYRDLTEGELRLSLGERLQPSPENPSNGLVLIVDEAQSLNLKLLEELRLLTNLSASGKSRVRLVLVGTLRLDELLGHPKMESLNQRIASRCYLKPLNADETARYIRHKVEICGSPMTQVFTDDAVRVLHRASDGIPRLIDQLADHALCLASEQGQRPVSASMVELAWSSLQQLPPPWLPTTTMSVASSVTADTGSVEFGTLEDEDEEFEQAEVEFEVRSQQRPVVAEPASVAVELQDSEPFMSVEDDLLSTTSYDTFLGLDLSPTSPIEIAKDPFGSDFEQEYAVDLRAGSANSASLRDEVDSLESPILSSVRIPEFEFDESVSLDEATVEREVREMISNLNIGSVSLSSEPSLSVSDLDSNARTSNPTRSTFHSSVFSAQPQLLSFATLGSNSPTMGDDRDLLVVEEDLSVRQGGLDAAPTSTPMHAQTPHNYVQLFSKLRG